MAFGTKISKSDRVLVVLFVAVFFVSVGALFAYNRYLATLPNMHDDVIAYVEAVSPIIKRKPPNGVEFLEINQSEAIVNGDHIYSGEGSNLTLKFTNGPRILIGEKSQVTLRENEGTPEVKVESGTFSGTFEDSDTIEVLTDNDTVTLNGEQESQFAVSYVPGNSLEISSFDQELKLEFNGKSASIKNQTAKLSQKKGIEVKDRKGAPTRDQASVDTKPQLPEGIEDLDSSANPIVGLTAPYPQENQMFFHTKGGKIPILPKATCSGSCEVKLFINGAEAMSKFFKRDAAPLIQLKISNGMEAKVKWEFSDGGQKTEGIFEIRLNNKDNFEKAFSNKFPVEVIN